MISNPLNIHDFVNVKSKDKKWAREAIRDYYFNYSCHRITGKKDVSLIRSYATGNQSIAPIKKSLFSIIDSKVLGHSVDQQTGQRRKIKKQDLTGINWVAVGVLTNILNAAKARIKRKGIAPHCTAIDPLGRNKVNEDLLHLKTRKFREADMKEFSHKMRMNMTVDNKMKNGEAVVDIEKVDLDPQQDDELNLYKEMFYKLKIENALETLLTYDEYINCMNEVKDKVTDDQYELGVSGYRRFMNKITGLPDAQYLDPQFIRAPYSVSGDWKDVPFVYTEEEKTFEEVLKCFGDELKTDKEIGDLFDRICICRKLKMRWNDILADPKKRREIAHIMVPIIYMEWKSWDGMRILEKKTKNGRSITDVRGIEYDTDDANKKTYSKWVQNTYGAYYIECADQVLGFYKLDNTYRAPGNPAMSDWSICIRRSAEVSPVELSIPFVDDWHRAFFKFQHALLKSRTAGIQFNFAHLHNALDNLKDDTLSTMDLVTMLFQENVLFTDSGAGVDEITNNPPFSVIPASNITDMIAFIQIMQSSRQQIREILGIPQVIEGIQPNPKDPVATTKLAVEGSLNSTFHIDKTIKYTIEDGLRYTSGLIQEILNPKNKDTAPYKSLVAFAGRHKASVIESMKEIPAHQFGIMIEDFPSDREMQLTEQILLSLFNRKEIDVGDLFAIKRLINYKEAEALMVLRSRKKELQRREELKAAAQLDMAKEQMKLQYAQITSGGEVQEEKIRSATMLKINDLTEKVKVLLSQMKIGAANFQIDKRHQNKLQELAAKKAEEALAAL